MPLRSTALAWNSAPFRTLEGRLVGSTNSWRISPVKKFLVDGWDMRIIYRADHLAVVSFDEDEFSAFIDALGSLGIADAEQVEQCRGLGFVPIARFTAPVDQVFPDWFHPWVSEEAEILTLSAARDDCVEDLRKHLGVPLYRWN